MKLVTGVDISSRPVKVAGRPGKAVKRSRRTAAAEANRATVFRSIFRPVILKKVDS